MNIAVFASGRGSNFKAIFSKIKSGEIEADIACLITNNTQAPALDFAKENKIDTYTIDFNNNIYVNQLLKILKQYKIQLIVLAGFLKLISEKIVQKYPNKIINIHPSLLPSFGGRGCYGVNVHKKVFKSGVKFTGATVHFVNQNYDEGQIIAQEIVPISSGDSVEDIAAKVLKVEHKLLPDIVNYICRNQLYWKDNKPWIKFFKE